MTILSIIIPSRNEMFLNNTISDILKNIEMDTEIIVVLDGQWGVQGIPQHERVTVVYVPESIGQRAATNLACKLSKSKYIMKVDAHCSFDKGFDRKLIDGMNDNWTVVPAMKNLHAFDWVCECGHRRYQGPTKPCEKCGKEMKREIIWHGKESPLSTSYRFNPQLEFKYWSDYKKQQTGDIVDTMSLQGSCFMLTRDKYWELDICDESWGSWGGQGAEVALKTWLSGGEVKCNTKTWYAHMFRTQGGDFGFPYPNPGNEQKKAKDTLRDTFLNNKWDKAKYKLQWLIDKFNPPEWEQKTKGIIYYTDNKLKVSIAKKVQRRLTSIGLPISSASLKPMPHFGSNVHIKKKRGYLTMFEQILSALENSKEEIVFFCEHDVLYHPSHFKFIPPKKDVFYYNVNVWKTDGDKALKVDVCKQTSGICVYREHAIKHYKRRIEYIKDNGFSRRIGFEPGTHKRIPELIDKSDIWNSKYPNIDIRHDNNLTQTRWNKEQFKNQKYTKGWIIKDYKTLLEEIK